MTPGGAPLPRLVLFTIFIQQTPFPSVALPLLIGEMTAPSGSAILKC